MSRIFVFLFLASWSVFILSIGIPEIFPRLGACLGFYFLLPFIALLSLRYKAFKKLLWATILTLAGLVAINYMIWYFSNMDKNYNLLIRLYVVGLPLMAVAAGYTIAIHNFFVARGEEDRRRLKPFFGFLCASFMMPWVSCLLIIITLLIEKVKNINIIAYQVGLGCLITSGLILFIGARKISISTLDYYAQHIPRFAFDIRRIRRWLIIIGTCFLLSFSISLEPLRRDWLTWTESGIIFVVFMATLYRFGRIIFFPMQLQNQKLANHYLPGLSFQGIMIISFMIPVLWLATIILIKVI